ncbi:ubiquitin carboxyl-terminal hydrolase 12-like [Poecilia reticulata]|nr:PREDICTED: ubiquitin carboxyl-terminal hydrolase 12-like [Poecilia reticulata]
MASEEASKIFEIQLNNKTICGDCEEETDEKKSFWNLPLPLKQSSNESYSVKDAIKDFFKDSHFTEDNQLYCEKKCEGKRDATVKCVINQHPEVLMLLLKRFEFNYYQMCFVKNTCKVDVPFIVEIPRNQTYELYAFVEHFGSLKSGHYTATIRSQDDDRWYNFNDSLVTELNNRPFQGNKIEGTQSAYLLFYRKKGADQDNRKVPNKRDLLPDNNKNSRSCPYVCKTEKDEDAKPTNDEASRPKRRKRSENADEDGPAGLPTRESSEMVERNRENSAQEAERLTNDKQHHSEKAKLEMGDRLVKNVNYKTKSQVESSSITQINPLEKGVVRADVHKDINKQVNDHSKMEEMPDLKSNQYDRQGQENSSGEPLLKSGDKTQKPEPTSVKKQDSHEIEADEDTHAPLQEKPDKKNNKGIKPKKRFRDLFKRKPSKDKVKQPKVNSQSVEASTESGTERTKDTNKDKIQKKKTKKRKVSFNCCCSKTED